MASEPDATVARGYTPRDVTLGKSTIATVGSGVMAEAMIAGLLRGKLSSRRRSSPAIRAPERREQLEREYGIRTVASNVEAVDGADVILLGIKPQMLARVGREIGRTCTAASSSSASWPAPRPRPSSASSATTRSSGACPTRRPGWARA